MSVNARSRALWPAVVALGAACVCGTAAAKPRAIENADLKYTITVPSECRTEEGPGTLEAICAPDFDEAKSAELPAASALLLEIDAEQIPADAKPYGDTEFRREAPEAVCGDGDISRVKLSDVKEARDGAATVFTATIACPEIKFLGLPERQAQVRYVMQPRYRYRLMARSLVSDADKTKAVVASFFASFKATGDKAP
jgi:hypothetical protein